MKKLMIALIALSCTQARAANEGPHGAPARNVYVAAEVTIHPGFAPPHMRAISGVRIYSNGTVTRFKDTTETATARLSRAETRALLARVDAIRETELVDLQEGQPRCTDAPSRSYEVRKTEASPELRIAAWSGCHTFVLKNRDGAAIVELLNRYLR